MEFVRGIRFQALVINVSVVLERLTFILKKEYPIMGLCLQQCCVSSDDHDEASHGVEGL